jgi:hypothetical protein
MLRLIDGYDYIPVGASPANFTGAGWLTNVENMRSISATRFSSGRAITFTRDTTATQRHYRSLTGPLSSSVFGTAMRFPENGDVFCLALYDSLEPGPQVSLVITIFGSLILRRGDFNGTSLAAAAIPNFRADVWFYLEVKSVISNTVGEVEVRVNGVPLITLTAADTQATANSTWDVLGYHFPSANIFDLPVEFPLEPVSFDDFYLLDTTGSVNNDFLGNCRVQLQQPDAAGDLTQFIRANMGLTNWQNAINQSINDTLYVEGTAIGDRDLYNTGPISNLPPIFGVAVTGAYRQADATQREGVNLIKTNGVVYEGDPFPTNSTYSYHQSIWELNPDTGVSWTALEVNALQIGPKVES